MQIGVSNPNVPIFLPRVCTLVLFIYIVIIIIVYIYSPSKIPYLGKGVLVSLRIVAVPFAICMVEFHH